MTTNKELAITLRKEGYTYKEIAEQLDGISVDWCKRNLKGIKREKKLESVVEELLTLATRPEGCTHYEAVGVVYKHNPDIKVSSDKVKSIKTRAKSIDSNCLFRQGWEDTKQPLASHRLMLSLAHDLYERTQEMVNDYMQAFPNTSRQAVLNEMVKIANGFLSPEPLERRLERNEETISKLEDRTF